MHSRFIMRPWTESILAVPLGDMVLSVSACSKEKLDLVSDYRNVEVSCPTTSQMPLEQSP